MNSESMLLILDGAKSKEMNKIADEQYKVFKGEMKDKEKGSYKMGPKT